MVKGQIKIQQMAFMLIAVTIFFSLVALFFVAFGLNSAKSSAELLEEESAMLLVSKLANAPEFSCENTLGNNVDCVDFDKAMAFKKNFKVYENFWEIENIEIRKTYPNSEVICTVENYPDCGIMRFGNETVKGVYVSNFVSICYKESSNGGAYDKCNLGIMMVSYDE